MSLLVGHPTRRAPALLVLLLALFFSVASCSQDPNYAINQEHMNEVQTPTASGWLPAFDFVDGDAAEQILSSKVDVEETKSTFQSISSIAQEHTVEALSEATNTPSPTITFDVQTSQKALRHYSETLERGLEEDTYSYDYSSPPVTSPTPKPTPSPVAEGSPTPHPTQDTTVTLVTWSTTVSMSGVTAADFGDEEETSFKESIAAASEDLTADSITITSITDVTRRRTSGLRSLLTSAVDVEYETTVILEETSYTDTSALFSAVSAKVNTYITTGDFETALQASGSTKLASVDVGEAGFDEPTEYEAVVVKTMTPSVSPTAAPPSNKKAAEEDSTGMIIGIIAGILVVFGGAAAAFMYMNKKKAAAVVPGN